MNEKEFVKGICDEASRLGACFRFSDVLKGTSNLRDLLRLLRTPQGTEFCIGHGFPDYPIWEEADKRYGLSQYGIFVGQNIDMIGRQEAFYIGSSGRAYCRRPLAYRITLMHGSRLSVYAANYAAVNVERSSDSVLDSVEKDNTAVVLW